MTKAELEEWVLRICDKVIEGHPLEDDRVELKRTYLGDRQDEARRIAGLCNSARGESALWLVGVDEKGRSVPGAPAEPDPANWLQQLETWWPDLAPERLLLGVPYQGVMVQAYLFDTSRAPYTVKVSDAKRNREVPFRVGTQTRSARREDLLRLLVPLVRRPDLTVLGGELSVWDPSKPVDPPRWRWHGLVRVYVTTTAPLIFPDHMTGAELTFAGDDLKLKAVCGSPGRSLDPQTAKFVIPGGTVVSRGDGQLMVGNSSPIGINLYAETGAQGSPVIPGASGRLSIDIGMPGVDDRQIIRLEAALRPADPENVHGSGRVVTGRWKVVPAEDG